MDIISAKSMMLANNRKKECFANVIIDVLKKTEMKGIDAVTNSSRCFNELDSFKAIEGVRPFVDWFSSCITDDNCVTCDELEMYNRLKMTGELVPEQDLDALIGSFCSEPTADMFDLNYKLAIDTAKKELESLESLENFLIEREKMGERKKKPSNFDLQDTINNELFELENLNKRFNEVLEDYGDAWEDLRKTVSNNQMESKTLSDDMLRELNNLIKKIEEILRDELIFKEVKKGMIEATPQEYWLVFKNLVNTRKQIINSVSIKEFFSSGSNHLDKLKNKISSIDEVFTLEEIKMLLDPENIEGNLQHSLDTLLKQEKDCISSLQIQDAQNCFALFSNRLDRLKTIENVLKLKKLYNNAFSFSIKQNKLVYNFQVEKLQESFKSIELYLSNFEERMDLMRSYTPKKEQWIDSNYKTMMNCLNANDFDLSTLDEKITSLHETINLTNNFITKKFCKFEYAVYKRSKTNKETYYILFDGPTREAFDQVSNNYLAPIESVQKDLSLIKKKISKIRTMFQDLSINEHSRTDSLWLKNIIDPKDFISTIIEMEAKANLLAAELEPLMIKNSVYQV